MLFFLVVTGLFFGSCTPGNKKKESGETSEAADTLKGTPKIVFDKDSHDFGTIVQGEVVSYTFLYMNKGKEGLIITSASSSCGCTVPDYSKEPLLPGEQGKLEVVFNSKGKMGVQNKTVAIRTNGVPVRKILKIHVEVVPDNSN